MKQGEIYLVPFPFSDFSGSKVRPIVIISKNEFNNHSHDLIVCGVTTNLSKDNYTIQITTKSLVEGKLFSESAIKAENILRIDKSLLIKKIGKINQDKIRLVIQKLNQIFT
ncbi:type II toxin-antitoxin system PemK/MazF family toxin [Candidatus Woesearchaeota archaeon]|jgi:mRNA interferase MazF|nr:type II toxin-antitoxin system PemK/MazF family toxin [Candidatus Woesearchaeota archaeon]